MNGMKVERPENSTTSLTSFYRSRISSPSFWRLTGELHAPLDICGSVIKRELDFWGIEEEMIEPCCWNTYTAFRDAQKTLAELDEDIEGMEKYNKIQTNKT